jgi:hypothetical protein
MGTFVIPQTSPPVLGHPNSQMPNTYLKQISSSVVEYSNSIGQLHHRVWVGYLKQVSSSVVEYSNSIPFDNSIVFRFGYISIQLVH